jgi:hypothetical protein
MSTSGREVARRESRARLETGLGVVRMADDLTIIAGIPIPSTSPLFLSVVGSHVLAGLLCTIMGVVAMLSNKARGRHSNFGTVYYWGFDGCFRDRDGSGGSPLEGGLSLVHLGKLSLAAAYLGRRALRQHWWNWLRLHLMGMGASYILPLTAFYVDNGKSLPLGESFHRQPSGCCRAR